MLDTNERDVATGRGRHVRRLRVLHLLNSFESGGTERQAVEMLKRIDPERYDVRLAVLSRQGPLYREIHHLWPSVPEFPLTSFYNANAVRQLRRLCALLTSERIDIVHAHDFYSGMIGVAAARLARRWVIASQRNLRQSDRRVHKWGQRFIVRLAHRVLVNAEAIREEIVRNGIAPVHKLVVIRNGLQISGPLPNEGSIRAARRFSHDTLCRELGIDAHARLIGIVANLGPIKSHHHLIEAVPRILREHPAAHAVIVGEGELRKQLENQAERLHVAPRVHFLGWRADAASLHAAFDVEVLTSLHEGLPNSVMEAMAAGTPVVATAVGGIPELIQHGETGFLTSPGDPEGLADHICHVLANEHASLEMGIRGRDFIVSRFDMRRMVDEVQDLYDQVAAELWEE